VAVIYKDGIWSYMHLYSPAGRDRPPSKQPLTLSAGSTAFSTPARTESYLATIIYAALRINFYKPNSAASDSDISLE